MAPAEARSLRDLWIAVLARAVVDASRYAPSNLRCKTEEQHAVRDAYNWINHGGEDFQLVCEMAGIDARAVQRALHSGRAASWAAQRRDMALKDGRAVRSRQIAGEDV